MKYTFQTAAKRIIASALLTTALASPFASGLVAAQQVPAANNDFQTLANDVRDAINDRNQLDITVKALQKVGKSADTSGVATLQANMKAQINKTAPELLLADGVPAQSRTKLIGAFVTKIAETPDYIKAVQGKEAFIDACRGEVKPTQITSVTQAQAVSACVVEKAKVAAAPTAVVTKLAPVTVAAPTPTPTLAAPTIKPEAESKSSFSMPNVSQLAQKLPLKEIGYGAGALIVFGAGLTGLFKLANKKKAAPLPVEAEKPVIAAKSAKDLGL